jgi:hypothetical protein
MLQRVMNQPVITRRVVSRLANPIFQNHSILRGAIGRGLNSIALANNPIINLVEEQLDSAELVDRVSCTMAIEATRRTASASAALAIDPPPGRDRW